MKNSTDKILSSTDRHKINNKLQIILSCLNKLDPKKAKSLQEAAWDISNIINESSTERLSREFDELLEAGKETKVS